MKNIIKKNQVVIGTIALMLIAAGYMNYTANTKNTLKDAALADSEKYAALGDAQLVSSNVVSTNTENNNNNTVENCTNTNNTTNTESDANTQCSTDSTVSTSNNDNNSDTDVNKYFTQSKIDRDNMYSEMLDSYQKMLDNEQMSSAQKGIAQNEIKNINDKKNAIMIAENLIKNKGFDNVVIFINDQNIDIVVKSKQLKTEQIAQIQNIIQRELKADIEDIHISSK